jgi:hypothetical protein
MQFPDAAIEILRQARWNPNAERHYDVLSGGFYWTDEKLTEVASICSSQQNWTHRAIIAYRASIISDNFVRNWKLLGSTCQKNALIGRGFVPKGVAVILRLNLKIPVKSPLMNLIA